MSDFFDACVIFMGVSDGRGRATRAFHSRTPVRVASKAVQGVPDPPPGDPTRGNPGPGSSGGPGTTRMETQVVRARRATAEAP